MSGIVRSFGHLWDRVAGKTTGTQLGVYPRTPPPPPPTIDDAAKQTQDFDRIRRRKGVLANIFGGASDSSPSVGTKQLLGE